MKPFTRIMTCSLAILLSGFVNAQDKQPEELKHFLKQSQILLMEGGKWNAVNKNFDPKDQESPSYYGYEYSTGVHPNMLRLKFTGYLPKLSQWIVYRQGFYSWDPVKRKVLYQGVSSEGNLMIGQSLKIAADEMTIEFSIHKMEGGIERQKDEQRFSDTGFVSQRFTLKDNKWEKTIAVNWNRLEQPVGKILYMSTRDGNFEIYCMDANGENLKNLSCNTATDYAFSYFPDGRLSFYTSRDGNDEIYVMDSTGKKQRNLTKHPSGDRIAHTSPDGTKIIFISDRDSKNGEIYIMDSSGQNTTRITHNDYFEDAASSSPDGKKIIFSRDIQDRVDSANKPISNGEIFIMDVDGKNEKRLTNRPGFDGGPVFSPDGKKIAFYGKTATGNYEIFLMDADGSNLVNLTEDPLEDYSPAWSPDGKWIAYTKGNASNYDIWAIQLETKIKTRLTTNPKRDESPVWAPAARK